MEVGHTAVSKRWIGIKEKISRDKGLSQKIVKWISEAWNSSLTHIYDFKKLMERLTVDPKPNSFTSRTGTKIGAIFAVFTTVMAGLAGSAIPIWYVRTHLSELPEPGVAGGIIFDLIVIIFGMSFIIAWVIIWIKVRRFFENFSERK